MLDFAKIEQGIKTYDFEETDINDVVEHYDLIVTIEDNAIAGGAGSAVSEHLNGLYINSRHISANLLQIGFPDELINHGQPDELLPDWKLDKAGILQSIQARIKSIITP